MASIKCILDYDENGLNTTYQIVFDNTDKFELVSLKHGITLVGSGPSGIAVKLALENEGIVKDGSQHQVGKQVEIKEINTINADNAIPTKFATLTVGLDDLVNFNLAHFECTWQDAKGKTQYGGTQCPEPPLGL